MDEHNRTGLGPQGFMPHNSRGDQGGVPQYLGAHSQGKRRANMGVQLELWS
jgi:hypothetical protein